MESLRFNSCWRQSLQTRTAVAQPRAGTGILCWLHEWQKPSPQPRQWCLGMPHLSKLILQALQCYVKKKKIKYWQCYYTVECLQLFHDLASNSWALPCRPASPSAPLLVAPKDWLLHRLDMRRYRQPFVLNVLVPWRWCCHPAKHEQFPSCKKNLKSINRLSCPRFIFQNFLF